MTQEQKERAAAIAELHKFQKTFVDLARYDQGAIDADSDSSISK